MSHLKEETALKRSLSLLLASLMLVFALTACGRRNDTPQDNGQNGTQNESAVVGGETANNGSNNQSNNGTNDNNTNGTTNGEDHPVLDDLENAGENVVQGAGDVGKAVTDGVRRAGNALTGNNRTMNRSADGTAYYNQTLSNNGTLKQNGNVVTFQNPVLPGIF